MTFPASATALVPLIQASDGVQPGETVTIPGTPYQYRLGANASPALPAGLQRIPKGAFPLPAPGVISGSSDITTKGHFLVPSSVYKYALTNITKSGETTADSVYTAPATGATASDSTGKLLTLPAVTASTANPVIARRLYRTVAGGTALKWCADLDDLSLTTWADGKADEDLGAAPPVSNGSGLTGAVAVSGGGYGSWTEKAPGSSLTGGDFIVDYSYSVAGGLITFAAVDAGKTVTVTYTATTFVNAALFNTIIAALKDMAAVVNKAGAVSVPDGTTLPSISMAPVPGTSALPLVLKAGALVSLRLSGVINAVSVNDVLRFRVTVGGAASATVQLWQFFAKAATTGSVQPIFELAREAVYTAASDGTYTFQLEAEASSTGSIVTGNDPNGGIRFIAQQIG